tara:strand:- start:3535 stop:4611 length:1077 start_codon:yes stop_codon:yes gene_type:complete
VDIKTFLSVAPLLPAEMAILLRGPTGTGKSMIAKGVADAVQLPFIDVRGSTMQEGDVGGYPDMEGMKENGIMTFCMPSWFVRACREPVVLMLDELNRSLIGVMQSFFQLVLDRELGNDANGVPYQLHPETRVIAAINCGSEYTVEEMDPALLRRFWVVDLEPTKDDFLDWASDKLDSVLIDFIRQHPEHLRVDPGSVESGTVCPNPASWHRLNDALVHANLVDKPESAGFYAICTGFIGAEASIAFNDFARNYSRQVTAEDLLNSYDQFRDKIETMTADRQNALIAKLSEWCKDGQLTVKQAKNIKLWTDTLGDEITVHLWNSMTKSQNLPNIQKLHKLIGSRIVKAVNVSRNLEPKS